MITTTDKEITAASLTYKERLAFFEEWQKGLSEAQAEPIPDEALTRESIYCERIDRQG
jgi:hypothetical protein